ncbi:hypothetical protein MTO96_037920 [Rhipicephalus appendiculatus]
MPATKGYRLARAYDQLLQRLFEAALSPFNQKEEHCKDRNALTEHLGHADDGPHPVVPALCSPNGSHRVTLLLHLLTSAHCRVMPRMKFYERCGRVFLNLDLFGIFDPSELHWLALALQRRHVSGRRSPDGVRRAHMALGHLGNYIGVAGTASDATSTLPLPTRDLRRAP